MPALLRFFVENREHLAPWEPSRPADFLTEEFWRMQVGRHRRAFENGSALMFFLFLRDQPQEVIGQVSLTGIVRGPAEMCMLGYALAQDAQGQGYMHEALVACLEFAFREENGGLVWRSDAEALERIMRAWVPAEQRWAMLREIRCPTLVVRGTRSNVLADDVARRMMRELRDGTLLELDSGHNVALERPRELAEAVVALAERAPS